MSIANKGKKRTKEQCEKMKIAQSKVVKVYTEEHRKANSLLHTGKINSEQTRKKMSDNHWTKQENRGFSESQKENMRNASYMNKKVINTKTNKIFRSAAEVNRMLGWRVDRLGKYLRNENINKTDFLYLEEYNKLNQINK